MSRINNIINKILYSMLSLVLLSIMCPLTVFSADSTPAANDLEMPKRTKLESDVRQAVPSSITEGYEVYFGTPSGTLIGKYNTLADACAAVNSDGSGSDYAILVTADDPEMGTTATIDAGKAVTLKSTAGANYVLTKADSGRHIFVNGGLILENITLDGNGTSGGIHGSGGTLGINHGAVVTKCASAVSGSGIYLSDSTFTMNGGEISDNHQSTTFGASGGGVYLIRSTFTMIDGIITNNSAVWGGGVEVNQDSVFTMKGGEISNNRTTEAYGGGVHVYVHGTFIMDDGKILNNKTPVTNAIGGGVFVGQGTHVGTEPTDWCKFIMNGGSIEGNESYFGGGVAACWNGKIEMNGGSIFSNKAAAGSGVFLTRSLYEDGGVSFTMKGGEINGNSATVAYGGGIWARGDETQYTVNVVIGDSTGAAATTPLIYDNRATSQGGGMFLYGSNAHATIYGGKIYRNAAGSLGGGICVYGGSTLRMNGGIIGGENADDANTTVTSGGGIAMYSGSNRFTMTGGKVTGNEAQFSGGGIYLTNASYSITDGEISKNIAKIDGGGLYITNSATAATAISDLSIVNNKAAKFGGGAYIANAVNVENVSISNNNASSGGGAYVSAGGSLTAVNGTSFTNNSAVDEGGGIYTEDYTGFNGNIPGDYSGVQTGDYGNLTTSADTVFRKNTALAVYEPPTDADSIFSNIGYASSSILRSGKYINPINNYDINYAKEPKILILTVTYDANGGTGSHTVTGIASGSEHTVLTLDDSGISRDGYDFTGWNTAADGSREAYAPGDSFVVTDDVTLYAQWVKVSEPEEPTQPSEPETPAEEENQAKAPSTGDNQNLWFWGLTSLISLALLIVQFWRVRRKKTE